MRIAVSGSHSLGKSTVVNDWIARHGDSSTRLHNGLQLYCSIGRVHRYATAAQKVIFDRAPVDYLVYSQYTADQGAADIDDGFVESMVSAIRESLECLDVLAFVPQSEAWPVQMEDDGILPVDSSYREDVDAIFKQIYRDGRFDILPRQNGPLHIELAGSRQQRLLQVARAVEQRGGS